jgi:hypothetical protein
MYITYACRLGRRPEEYKGARLCSSAREAPLGTYVPQLSSEPEEHKKSLMFIS